MRGTTDAGLSGERPPGRFGGRKWALRQSSLGAVLSAGRPTMTGTVARPIVLVLAVLLLAACGAEPPQGCRPLDRPVATEASGLVWQPCYPPNVGSR